MLCIITSGTENLNILNLCRQLSIPYTLVIDSLFQPYQDKEEMFLQERAVKIMEYMSTQWATHFIISPSIELSLLKNTKEAASRKPQATIIPLFKNYLIHCLNHSLVGKIWFVGWYSDISQIESIFETMSKEYILTENQKDTKKFKLSKRTKDTSMRWYFTRLFSSRDMMINKIIKTDLRYFKDANVDTIIPLDYSYFNHQKTIISFFNQKKHKFHKRDILGNIFENIIEENKKLIVSNPEPIIIYYTGSLHLISENKKWERLISQGKQKTIEYKKITL
jgi:hypothetical protein